MNRLAFLIATWIVAINLIAPPARAASTAGVVVGPGEHPVEGAIVQLIARDGRVLQEARSDQSGRFTLDAPSEATWLQARTDEMVSSPQALGGDGPGVELVVRLGDEFQAAQAGVDRKIESLRERLFEMQAELMALVESQAAGRATPSPNELTVAAPQRSSADSLYPYPADKGPQPEAAQDESSLPVSLPGRAYGDKGLNQGLAAGAPGRRYGRAIYSDFLRIGGYGSFRYENNNIALGPQVADLPRLKRGHDAFDFRRFVFTMDAAPHKRLRFYTEIEFERLNEIEVERTAIPENRGRATRNRPGVRFIQEVEGTSGGEIAVEQAWMQYSFTDEFSARVGVILPPVGRYNILHDDDYWDIARRPLAVTGGPVTPVKSAWREMGAGLLFSKPIGSGYLDGQFYFVNGVQLDFALETVAALREGRNLIEVEPEISFSSGAFDGSQDADAVTWRMAASPRIGHEIAVSGYHGRYTPDYLKQQAWVNTLALDGKSTIGRFEVEGEYIHTKFNRHQEVLNDIALQFVDSAAATSSAETSTLETEIEAGFKGPFTRSRAGFWLDLKYRLTPEWLRRGMLGRDFEDPQLIPVFRWERIYFNDFVRGFDFAGGAVTNIDRENAAQERFTLGLSYRPVPSVVLSGAWEHNRRLSGSALLFPTRPGTDPIPSKGYDGLIIGAAFGF
jgi:hypothetical protein